MKCIDVKENLDALLDEEFDFAGREKTEEHLETCVSCQTEFENLRVIGRNLKKNLPVVAPATLDRRVFSAFQNARASKTASPTEERTGWFGIPKLAFATAFLLLALFSGLGFQMGRIYAGVSNDQRSENMEGFQVPPIEEKKTEIKIVEVPLIEEKIVRVPEIREKVVIKKVYVNKKKGSENPTFPTASPNNDLALNSSVKDGEYFTQTNLKGFEPVSEIKARITKKEEEK